MSSDTRVTQTEVTKLFDLRTELWTSPESELTEIATRYGLSNTEADKKAILLAYLERHFPHSANNGEHFLKMKAQAETLHRHFAEITTDTCIYLFGSYSIGTINGTHSDLDLIAGLGSNPNDLVAFEQLERAGVIYSPELSCLDRMQSIVESGHGLARVYGVSEQGVEVEFHVLGRHDLAAIHKLKPGFVTRVVPVPPKEETRISFTGAIMNLPKDSTTVNHYLSNQGEYYRGFFPDAMIMSTLVLDSKGKGQEALDNVWFASVKAYLYHNGYLKKTSQGIVIDIQRANFDEFLCTVMPQKRAFTPERYQTMSRSYHQALNEIVNRYKCIILS
ncbi:hypothetical protein A2313_04130 [Candidatus Roizmanbacteria bacterium RIFOXYB2_FULL_41_10]|uniref:Uncharacterized protein n=1 Tax=Candidatus Roizmanbacteria bacterium RIFOXYA1_FULL_41_12 TaxID=1802082 RepID=A0A1F7KEZ7_9BACT|nr:MAG: hypothetical protein A2209_01585 [Candidatus Roizmanbacteria bacterium RIFOXYA1_FULL_41_12]OGK68142.1 MAG: hypothetical protein A2377_04245 [Candidatus Roizmanbacteria bacterium RIFOXYB1_FULL_41_27]OGK68574.1 MAG: hypothetical protein A2262_02150 [Candidatus Roizmanbacteria bacterium RIFOXYA2_FULL_41_8]OGK69275.1 MAG: hypothetical protein A2313_04130 [Candidatus Roizmanbacteria bacterium RIFOXYB2_FULL_41_10]OGK71928.1 MAG: hypothetical protein A2403_03165 [Candidatus Roizmanbacteria bac